MDSQRFFEKRFQWDRKTVHEFTSVRRLVNGHGQESSTDLQRHVVNKSIQYAFSNHPALTMLYDLCSLNRKNGHAHVNVDISLDNWLMVQGFLDQLGKKLDEGDIIQFCLKFYLDQVKLTRELP